MTAGFIERMICVVPPRLTSDMHRPFLEAAQLALATATAHGASELTLDLSGVERADAAGLGLLVMMHRRARGAGVRLVLSGAPEHLRELLAVAGLDRIFSLAAAA